MAICSPCGGSLLGVWGTCTHVVWMCVVSRVVHLCTHGSAWGRWTCLEGMYACAGMAFFFFLNSRYLLESMLTSLQMLVPRPLALEFRTLGTAGKCPQTTLSLVV